MDNFLTRLVRRTLGLMPVVQPMIASNFAPDEVVLGSYPSGVGIENNTTETFWGGEMSTLPPDVPVRKAFLLQRPDGNGINAPSDSFGVSLSNLPPKTSSLPENERSSLSTFEQLVDGNNELIVDSSIEISHQNREQSTVTQSDQQGNYIHNQADKFNIPLRSNLNKNISTFSQNPNPTLPDQQPNVFNTVTTHYLEEVTPSQKTSEKSLERIAPLVKREIETGQQAETKSSSLPENESSSLSTFEQLVDGKNESIIDSSIEISHQTREPPQTLIELQSRTRDISQQELIELVPQQPSENNFTASEPINPKQNKQNNVLSSSQLEQALIVPSQQLYFVQLGEDASLEKQENSRLGNEERQESKVYASSIVNKFISQPTTILSNSKLRVNQELKEEPPTSSDLSISQNKRVYDREFAFLTRRSLSVLSQSSSRQSHLNPIANNLPDSVQLNSSNRREVANAKHLTRQNASQTEATIQITIGRIEVTNNPPTSSAPPSKSSQRKPTLSLQDYLKQRQGEK